MNIGIAGIGYWGPNILSTFSQIDGVSILWLCDLKSDNLKKISVHADIKLTQQFKDLLEDKNLDAIIIATPAETHYDLARQTLQAKKHILVEKPLTLKSNQVFELHKLAAENGKILMVGHVFEYNANIRTIQKLLDKQEIGRIYYAAFERTNPGPVRKDVNAMWDLASHDFSIIFYLFKSQPVSITAKAGKYLNHSHPDLYFITLTLANGIICHIQACWLNPVKTRELKIIGETKMIVFDDLEILNPVKIFDLQRPFHPVTYEEYKTIIDTKSAPNIIKNTNQPLYDECSHFIDCIIHKKQPLSDAKSAFRVIYCLEKAEESLRNNSQEVYFSLPDL